jgi:hypothetical protein
VEVVVVCSSVKVVMWTPAACTSHNLYYCWSSINDHAWKELMHSSCTCFGCVFDCVLHKGLLLYDQASHLSINYVSWDATAYFINVNHTQHTASACRLKLQRRCYCYCSCHHIHYWCQPFRFYRALKVAGTRHWELSMHTLYKRIYALLTLLY